MSGPCAEASQPAALQGAERALQGGGNSVDAALAGFFAAAAADASVLLGSVVALVAGVGAPARMIDGRVCQPGLGSKRPRGLMPDDPVPAAARAAAPRSLGALALLHAYGARRALSAAIRPAVAAAKKLGAKKRAALLEEVARNGPAALGRGAIERALLAEFGTINGGLLGADDLRAARPTEVRIELLTAGELTLALPHLDTPPEGERPARPAQVIVAADVNGLVCALAYCPDPDALMVDELEIALSADAVPVRRGVSRITPQTPLSAAAPIAILHHRDKAWRAAIAAARDGALTADAFAAPLASDGAAAASPAGVQLNDLLASFVAAGASCAMAASVARRKTQLTRVG